MKPTWTALLFFLSTLSACSHGTNGAQHGSEDSPKSSNEEGWYRAELVFESGKGRVPFFLHLPKEGAGHIANAEERLEVDHEWNGSKVTVKPRLIYDSVIEASAGPDGTLKGTWDRYTPLWGELLIPFEAKPVKGPEPDARFPGAEGPKVDFTGTWRVNFEQLGLGIFELKQDENGVVRGYAQPHHYGDYQHLAGNVRGNKLFLSTFDGTNLAIYLEATMSQAGALTGEYNIADVWLESFTAKKEEGFVLPNELKLKPGVKELDIPALKKPQYQGKPVLLICFATWCPGCNDARALYKELYAKYHDKGLEVLAQSYDLSEDQEMNQTKIASFKEKHQVPWEIVPIPGTPETFGELEPFPQLDGMEALPVTIWIKRDGTVHAVHGGYAGPASGRANELVRARFEKLTTEILAE